MQEVEQRLSVGLGLFSIGLGLAELAAPESVAGFSGVPDGPASHKTVQSLGVREIGHGIALLSEPDRPVWAWARVCGDIIDLAYLGSFYGDERARRDRLALATAAVLGVTAVDLIAAQRLSRFGRAAGGARSRGVRVEHVVSVNRSIEEVYCFWRNFSNFPRFMRHLESVEVLDARRSRWRAKAPAGLRVGWDAEVLEDRENEWISWRSIEGSGIENSGSVRFQPAPGARGTEVRVELRYKPPAGELGRIFAYLFGEEPDQQIYEDLKRFKQLVETGEIPISEGVGLWRPAQPVSDQTRLRALAGVTR
jgi:uncharacterized membrane protein